MEVVVGGFVVVVEVMGVVMAVVVGSFVVVESIGVGVVEVEALLVLEEELNVEMIVEIVTDMITIDVDEVDVLELLDETELDAEFVVVEEIGVDAKVEELGARVEV